MNELLEFEGGVRGVALNLEEDNVGCVPRLRTEVKEGRRCEHRLDHLGPHRQAAPRARRERSATPLTARALGTAESDLRPIEQPAPSVVERQPVDEPMQTGIKAIDAMIPIGAASVS